MGFCVSSFPFSHTICPNFESVPCKNRIFECKRINFLHKKRSGFRVPALSSSVPPESLLIYMLFVRCRHPISPHASFPRTCPFQVPNYNIDISGSGRTPPATSPVSARLSSFPLPPAHSPSAVLSSFSVPHTSPCPAHRPVSLSIPHLISIYYSPNHLYIPLAVPVPPTFIRHQPHPAHLSFRSPL